LRVGAMTFDTGVDERTAAPIDEARRHRLDTAGCPLPAARRPPPAARRRQRGEVRSTPRPCPA
ncbi:hypothetical protein, partial [Streptomyces sp. CBMA123]|uniref:hypothetical protein n=1 Tax=Streptomyces sp. CBMA123 TaxID=1896313 RepID=UPI001CB7EFC7